MCIVIPDPRIPETGGQANKSNYGWDECCYWYCEGRLCYECSARLEEVARPEALPCAPVDGRVPSCSVPYQSQSRATSSRVRPLLTVALALAALFRTHWTVSTPLVNVRDSWL